MANDFAEALSDQIQKSGLTAYKLAQVSGVPKQILSNLLLGKTQPSWENVVKFARVLEVPLEVFVSDNIALPEPSEARGRGRPGKPEDEPEPVAEKKPSKKKGSGRQSKK